MSSRLLAGGETRYTRYTSSHRSKREISTVLGTLIFVGILFTSIVPMYLVMRQADTIYDKRMLEMKRLDEERAEELLDVFAFPMNQSSDTLNVTVRNRSEVAIRVVRLWVNDTFVNVNSTIVQPMGEVGLEPVKVVLRVNASYDIKVTTERGSVFVSDTGTLYYTSNGWEAEGLAINIIISITGSRFKITIKKDK